MRARLTARYYKADGKAGEARALPGDLFDGVVNEASIYAAVRAHQANRRQGTASAKNRGAVRGGGRKPWRQKGTGRARAGTNRSPIWRGGAVVFPPTPRSYRERLPKKVLRLARRSAFNARASADRVIVLEDLKLDRPKTKDIVRLLERLGVADEKVLLLTAEHRPVVYLSARNLPGVVVRRFGHESAYDVLWADTVVVEESALSGGGPGSQVTGAVESQAEDEDA